MTILGIVQVVMSLKLKLENGSVFEAERIVAEEKRGKYCMASFRINWLLYSLKAECF